ncbi:MAG: DUF433 domain-containing protein [Myxococcales bacterium]|nr:DUF433 domain-containing protein [Myxococcales bacterium]
MAAGAHEAAELRPALPRVLVPHPHVRSDARILGGSPHVVGSRVPVRRLWGWHQGGTTIDRLLKRYPSLGPAKVLDALSFAYDNEPVIVADIARNSAVLDAAATMRTARGPAQQTFEFMFGGKPG